MVCVKEEFFTNFLHIDDLLTRLQSQDVGCYWSHYFVGAVGYAEDMVLLAPSSSALRIM